MFYSMLNCLAFNINYNIACNLDNSLIEKRQFFACIFEFE